jgi:hypothetical protein
MALYFLKASGEFDAAVREWEQKPAVNMVEHQNLHLIGIRKGKQAEQTYCKEILSKQHRQAS